MPRLLLFDIDMTLIRTAGAGRLAMDRALEDVLGIPEVSKGILFDGRTDYGIFLEAIGRHSETPAALLPAMQAAYLEYLPAALEEKGGIVLAGVAELLDALDARGAAMGVATGNMREGAAAKLGFFGLWERFRGGGFGDNVLIRSELIVAASTTSPANTAWIPTRPAPSYSATLPSMWRLRWPPARPPSESPPGASALTSCSHPGRTTSCRTSRPQPSSSSFCSASSALQVGDPLRQPRNLLARFVQRAPHSLYDVRGSLR